MVQSGTPPTAAPCSVGLSDEVVKNNAPRFGHNRCDEVSVCGGHTALVSRPADVVCPGTEERLHSVMHKIKLVRD